MFSLRFSFMDDFVTLTEKKIGVPIFFGNVPELSRVSRKNCQVSRFPEKSPDSRNNFSYVPKQRLLELSPPVVFGWLFFDPQKSNRAKNCCTCLQYGKAPSNIDLVPTTEIATIFLKPRDSPRFVLQFVAAITSCVKTSFLLK